MLQNPSQAEGQQKDGSAKGAAAAAGTTPPPPLTRGGTHACSYFTAANGVSKLKLNVIFNATN